MLNVMTRRLMVWGLVADGSADDAVVPLVVGLVFGADDVVPMHPMSVSAPISSRAAGLDTEWAFTRMGSSWLSEGRLTMANLIYSAITSMDGYVADEDGNFDWAAPDEEVHAFVNDLERPVSTYLYGRRMYDVMVYWETALSDDNLSPAGQDFAQIWQAADKIVYSKTLGPVSTARTRIERVFDPEAVRQLKASTARDITVGGPNLAAQAIAAGLVDECHLFLTPIVVGGGTPSLPDHVRVELALLDERRFGNGVVYLRYRTRT
jgi:dihydrofolate reductase